MPDFKTVYECTRYLNGKALHPQASLVKLENPSPEHGAVKFDFYAILLIEACPDESSCCGRKPYDYSDATLVFLTPGETFRLNGEKALPSKGYLLAFHPDLLSGTTLKSHIDRYTFFRYRKEESLHLSLREKEKITRCLGNIEEELYHPIDVHSRTLLSRHIELLLDYCTRYYERQFITRENQNKRIVGKMERLLDEYIESGRLQDGQLPTPDYLAGELNLSTAYFVDLLKWETGKTPEQAFQLKRLEAARRMLLKPGTTPAAVARQLGYPNVQHFSLVFKKITGVAPGDYRNSQN